MKRIFLLFLLVFYSSYSYSAYYYVVASSASGNYSSLDQAISKEKAYLQGFNEVVGDVQINESTAIANHGSVDIYYKPNERYSYFMKHSFTWWIKEDYCSTSSARSELNNKINECFDNTPLNNEASHNYYCSEDAVTILGSCTYTPIDDECTGDACGGDGSGEGGEGGDDGDGSGSGGDGSGSGGDGSGSGGGGSGSGGDGSGSGGGGSGSGGDGSGSGGDGSGSDGQGSGSVDLSPVLNKLGNLQSTVDQNASTIKAALQDAQSANSSALADIESATRGLGSDLANIESATRGLGADLADIESATRGLGGSLADIADNTASTATRVNNLAASNREALSEVKQATTDVGNKLSADLGQILDYDQKMHEALLAIDANIGKGIPAMDKSNDLLANIEELTANLGGQSNEYLEAIRQDTMAQLDKAFAQFDESQKQTDLLQDIASSIPDVDLSETNSELKAIQAKLDELNVTSGNGNDLLQSGNDFLQSIDETLKAGVDLSEVTDGLSGVQTELSDLNESVDGFMSLFNKSAGTVTAHPEVGGRLISEDRFTAIYDRISDKETTIKEMLQGDWITFSSAFDGGSMTNSSMVIKGVEIDTSAAKLVSISDVVRPVILLLFALISLGVVFASKG